MSKNNKDTTQLAMLVARSREGDRSALDDLIQVIQPDLYKLAQRFLMSPVDAEDATQEILLKIITHLSQFDSKSEFMTWAYSVARNHLLDLKRKPLAPASFEDFSHDLSQGLSDNSFKGPDDILMLEEVRIGCTLAMLQCLDKDTRMAYILGEILELDHNEAAQVSDVSHATYRKRLSRARLGISSFMLGHCGLVDSTNRCRCSRRVKRASELGRVDPNRLMFSTSKQRAQQFPELLVEIRQLEDNQRAAALYRAQQQPAISQDFVHWLQNTLEQQESQRLN